MRFAIMLSWTSEVPPSMELALVLSQAFGEFAVLGALAVPFKFIGAARIHHQLIPALVEFCPVIFQHRRIGADALAGFGFVFHALKR